MPCHLTLRLHCLVQEKQERVTQLVVSLKLVGYFQFGETKICTDSIMLIIVSGSDSALF